MALYVNDYEFHVQSFKRLRKVRNNVDCVDCVQADGDELEYIRKKFTNIPMTSDRVVRWHGEMALFILSNI